MAKRKDNAASDASRCRAGERRLRRPMRRRRIDAPKADPRRIIDLERCAPPIAGRQRRRRRDRSRRSRPSRWRRAGYAPLAAAIALAVALGAHRRRRRHRGLAARRRAAGRRHRRADATRALQDSVAQLGSELATLKAGIATAQRSASAQFGKLAERLDRTEKAQAEPAAKLAKIRKASTGSNAASSRPRRRRAAPDVTGSVAPPKEESKPPVAEGWRLRDFYAGRAVVESRNGTLFEVGPGSNLPGLGRVESDQARGRQGRGGDRATASSPRRSSRGGRALSAIAD